MWSAKLMFSSNWVSSEDLLYIRCTLRGVVLMRPASHSLVWPWRRISSRIMEPICICIMLFVFRCYRFLELHSDDRRQKRRREISSPNCGRRKNLYKERQNTRLLASISTCHPCSLIEISYVSVRSEQIANAF